jgi:hypothetical protein
MTDQIKAAVSQLKIAEKPKKKIWEELVALGWAFFVFAFIAFTLGAMFGFAVLGYKVITTW